MIRLIIFDFDGTIVDSKRAYYDSITARIIPLGFRIKKIEETIDLGLNLAETLKKFAPSLLYRLGLRRKIMKDVLAESSIVKKCRDVSHIGDIHIKKILVSNSLPEFVIPVLKHLKFKKLFREIYCADDFDNKAKFIKTYLKIHGIRPYECFYVGDRIADIALANKVGCYSIIISGKCSWSSKNELIRAKPDFIIPSLADLNRIVNNFKDE